MNYEKRSPAIPSEFPDEWYNLNLNHHFWFVWRLRALQRLIRDNALDTQAPKVGLDIGCGVAFLRAKIESFSQWTLDGCDVNEACLQIAAAGRGRLLLYNIGDKQSEFKERYDLIFLFDVIEHIRDPKPFLESALWHLRPGGAVILNVPALPGLYSRYDELVGHFLRYTSGSMRQLLDSLSVKVTVRDLRYWGFSLIPLLGLRNLAVKTSCTPQAAIHSGFQISEGFINRALCAASGVETALWAHPPIGTSLMALATRD